MSEPIQNENVESNVADAADIAAAAAATEEFTNTIGDAIATPSEEETFEEAAARLAAENAAENSPEATEAEGDDADAAAEVVIGDITRLALELGGTISGEHGIGLVKQAELPWQIDSATRHAQKLIKHALDPKNILTPGRGI